MGTATLILTRPDGPWGREVRVFLLDPPLRYGNAEWPHHSISYCPRRLEYVAYRSHEDGEPAQRHDDHDFATYSSCGSERYDFDAACVELLGSRAGMRYTIAAKLPPTKPRYHVPMW